MTNEVFIKLIELYYSFKKGEIFEEDIVEILIDCDLWNEEDNEPIDIEDLEDDDYLEDDDSYEDDYLDDDFYDEYGNKN